jgi:hypothetical protein
MYVNISVEISKAAVPPLLHNGTKVKRHLILSVTRFAHWVIVYFGQIYLCKFEK